MSRGSIACLLFRTLVGRASKATLRAYVHVFVIRPHARGSHTLYALVEGWRHLCRHVGNGQDHRDSRYVRHQLNIDCLTSFHAEEDSDLVCQPGVGWMEINQTLKEKGIPLFFPVSVKPSVYCP